MHPRVTLLVTRQDEAVGTGGPRAYVPTYGHAASAVDVYRTVAVQTVSNRPASWCLTDLASAAALGRIVDGPIESAVDLTRAESALRCILLHEYVEVAVPCVKADYGTGMVGYVRLDKGERKAAAFDAFQVAVCFDRLFATEYVEVSNGLVERSSNSASTLVGKGIEELPSQLHSLSLASSEVAVSFPMAVGASTYYSSDEFTVPTASGTAGFIDELYRRVYRPWMELAQETPPIHVELKLPPLLAILLNRAPTRETIPDALRDLREELRPARAELNQLNEMLESSLTQADLHDQCLSAMRSFDAVVPEALLTSKQRWKRRIASVYRSLRPLHQLYSIAVDPLAVDSDQFRELFETTKSAVAQNSRIVARSVAAAGLAELLKTESVRSIVKGCFSESEIDLLTRQSA